MLPLVLDLKRIPLVLVGNGGAALRRLGLLEEAGAASLEVFAAAPSAELAAAAGPRLRRRWPSFEELARARLVFLADAPPDYRDALAAAARGAGALLHVEDAPSLSDAHAPAVLRRGDLTIAVSTGGRSPALAVQVKRFLAGLFGPEWRGRLDGLSAQRRAWRAAGAGPEAIAQRTAAWMASRGWLVAGPSSAAARDSR